MKHKYIVTLTEEERQVLVQKGKTQEYRIKHAKTQLKLAEIPENQGWTYNINPPSADGMICGALICFRNLTDLYQFSFFSTRLERCENIHVSFYTHISMIAPVMVISDCF